jgi:hypothetical protein
MAPSVLHSSKITREYAACTELPCLGTFGQQWLRVNRKTRVLVPEAVPGILLSHVRIYLESHPMHEAENRANNPTRHI